MSSSHALWDNLGRAFEYMTIEQAKVCSDDPPTSSELARQRPVTDSLAMSPPNQSGEPRDVLRYPPVPGSDGGDPGAPSQNGDSEHDDWLLGMPGSPVMPSPSALRLHRANTQGHGRSIRIPATNCSPYPTSSHRTPSKGPHGIHILLKKLGGRRPNPTKPLLSPAP